METPSDAQWTLDSFGRTNSIRGFSLISPGATPRAPGLTTELSPRLEGASLGGSCTTPKATSSQPPGGQSRGRQRVQSDDGQPQILNPRSSSISSFNVTEVNTGRRTATPHRTATPRHENGNGRQTKAKHIDATTPDPTADWRASERSVRIPVEPAAEKKEQPNRGNDPPTAGGGSSGGPSMTRHSSVLARTVSGVDQGGSPGGDTLQSPRKLKKVVKKVMKVKKVKVGDGSHSARTEGGMESEGATPGTTPRLLDSTPLGGSGTNEGTLNVESSLSTFGPGSNNDSFQFSPSLLQFSPSIDLPPSGMMDRVNSGHQTYAAPPPIPGLNLQGVRHVSPSPSQVMDQSCESLGSGRGSGASTPRGSGHGILINMIKPPRFFVQYERGDKIVGRTPDLDVKPRGSKALALMGGKLGKVPPTVAKSDYLISFPATLLKRDGFNYKRKGLTIRVFQATKKVKKSKGGIRSSEGSNTGSTLPAAMGEEKDPLGGAATQSHTPDGTLLTFQNSGNGGSGAGQGDAFSEYSVGSERGDGDGESIASGSQATPRSTHQRDSTFPQGVDRSGVVSPNSSSGAPPTAGRSDPAGSQNGDSAKNGEAKKKQAKFIGQPDDEDWTMLVASEVNLASAIYDMKMFKRYQVTNRAEDKCLFFALRGEELSVAKERRQRHRHKIMDAEAQRRCRVQERYELFLELFRRESNERLEILARNEHDYKILETVASSQHAQCFCYRLETLCRIHHRLYHRTAMAHIYAFIAQRMNAAEYINRCAWLVFQLEARKLWQGPINHGLARLRIDEKHLRYNLQVKAMECRNRIHIGDNNVNLKDEMKRWEIIDWHLMRLAETQTATRTAYDVYCHQQFMFWGQESDTKIIETACRYDIGFEAFDTSPRSKITRLRISEMLLLQEKQRHYWEFLEQGVGRNMLYLELREVQMREDRVFDELVDWTWLVEEGENSRRGCNPVKIAVRVRPFNKQADGGDQSQMVRRHRELKNTLIAATQFTAGMWTSVPMTNLGLIDAPSSRSRSTSPAMTPRAVSPSRGSSMKGQPSQGRKLPQGEKGGNNLQTQSSLNRSRDPSSIPTPANGPPQPTTTGPMMKAVQQPPKILAEKEYHFDYVFDGSQAQTFRAVGYPMIRDIFLGYNVCLFAYGQTGSGKTYSMIGDGFAPQEHLAVPTAGGAGGNAQSRLFTPSLSRNQSFLLTPGGGGGLRLGSLSRSSSGIPLLHLPTADQRGENSNPLAPPATSVFSIPPPLGALGAPNPHMPPQVIGGSLHNSELDFVNSRAMIPENPYHAQSSTVYDEDLLDIPKEWGICPRFATSFFERINKMKQDMPNRRVTALMSMVEIYNEEVRDLLLVNPQQPASNLHARPSLKLFDDAAGNVQVQGLSEQRLESEEHFLRLIYRGHMARQQAGTNMNNTSSRSHSIIKLIVKQEDRTNPRPAEEHPVILQPSLPDLGFMRPRPISNAIDSPIALQLVLPTDGPDSLTLSQSDSAATPIADLKVRPPPPLLGPPHSALHHPPGLGGFGTSPSSSCLSVRSTPGPEDEDDDAQYITVKESLVWLVDLAGSERQKKSGVDPRTAHSDEANKINSSLLVLGRALNAFTENTPMPSMRDSKLTRLLAPCFGGNTRTFMLATIAPSCFNLTESLSTLGYAVNAKHMKNRAFVNVVLNKKLVVFRAQEKKARLLLIAHEWAEVNLLVRYFNDGLLVVDVQNQERAALKELERLGRKNILQYAKRHKEAELGESKLLSASMRSVVLQERTSCIARIRPFRAKTDQGDMSMCVYRRPMDPNLVWAQTPKGSGSLAHRFRFNAVHTGGQAEVYQSSGLPMLKEVFSGRDVCFLVMGQRGSGKSYTMHGEPNIPNAAGVFPRFMADLYTEIEFRKQQYPDVKIDVKLSCLEIVDSVNGGSVTDLLEKELKLRNHDTALDSQLRATQALRELARVRMEERAHDLTIGSPPPEGADAPFAEWNPLSTTPLRSHHTGEVDASWDSNSSDNDVGSPLMVPEVTTPQVLSGSCHSSTPLRGRSGGVLSPPPAGALSVYGQESFDRLMADVMFVGYGSGGGATTKQAAIVAGGGTTRRGGAGPHSAQTSADTAGSSTEPGKHRIFDITMTAYCPHCAGKPSSACKLTLMSQRSNTMQLPLNHNYTVKATFVELARPERPPKTASRSAQDTWKKTQESLLQVNNLLKARAEGSPTFGIGTRPCKLMKILAPVLSSGQCRLWVVGTVAPSKVHLTDSITTLQSLASAMQSEEATRTASRPATKSTSAGGTGRTVSPQRKATQWLLAATETVSPQRKGTGTVSPQRRGTGRSISPQPQAKK